MQNTAQPILTSVSQIGSAKGRPSQFITGSIGPGVTLQAAATGTTFYIIASSGNLKIQPVGVNGSGTSNTYQQYTGLSLDISNTFVKLAITNPNSVAVAYQIFVGFDSFIDNRLGINLAQNPLVAYPTSSQTQTRTAINIIDLSGGYFYDINGNAQLALARQFIYVSNLDANVPLLIQKFGSAVQNGPAVGSVAPLTQILLPLTGNYTLCIGGGSINAIVSEIYQTIPVIQ